VVALTDERLRHFTSKLSVRH